MRRYNETIKADVKRRMSPPARQSVAQISKELGIQIETLLRFADLVDWYNHRQRQRGIKHLMPSQRHNGQLWKFANIAGGFMSMPGNSIQGDGRDRRAVGVSRRESGLIRHRVQRTQKPLSWLWAL